MEEVACHYAGEQQGDFEDENGRGDEGYGQSQHRFDKPNPGPLCRAYGVAAIGCVRHE